MEATKGLQHKGQTEYRRGGSSFISPGKRGTNTSFDILPFVMPFTHVSRYPGAWNRKQQKLCRQNCFDYVVSDL